MASIELTKARSGSAAEGLCPSDPSTVVSILLH